MKYPNWVLLIFAISAILLGFLVNSAVGSAMEQFGVFDTMVGGVITQRALVAVVTAIIGFFVLLRTKRVIRFTDNVVMELKQVVSPDREETTRASTTVILTTFFTAGVLAAYDYIWKNLADVVLYSGWKDLADLVPWN